MSRILAINSINCPFSGSEPALVGFVDSGGSRIPYPPDKQHRAAAVIADDKKKGMIGRKGQSGHGDGGRHHNRPGRRSGLGALLIHGNVCFVPNVSQEQVLVPVDAGKSASPELKAWRIPIACNTGGKRVCSAKVNFGIVTCVNCGCSLPVTSLNNLSENRDSNAPIPSGEFGRRINIPTSFPWYGSSKASN